MTSRTRKLAIGVVGALVVAVAAVVLRTGGRDPIPPVAILRYQPGGNNALIEIGNRGRSRFQFSCTVEYSSAAPNPAFGILEPQATRQVSIPLPVGRPLGLFAVDFKTQSSLNPVTGLLSRLGIYTARPHTFYTNIAVLR